ncbi:inositol 1,3,4-trisphosphate 5/6-kinase 4 isoform X2 [Punica granatum]|uniref:inositol-1,3,4-trisphosphate 5/6-kinase n=2 Tax=Punica granatum TaxID=22663 RepID=A0A218XHW0_PUNGR|nr:inositol 1,3,4-trisphosphate 5/6-kinase 4 isoform X2 [Punica granatum]OWM84795.1 hypothetical protein CDL15_Pgr027582 [Punica granatum]
MEKSGVRGLVLDDSVLVAAGEAGSATQPRPGAESLLRHLRHSGIPTRIACGEDLPAEKLCLLKKMAASYSFECFALDVASTELGGAFNDGEGCVIYVISSSKKDVCTSLNHCNLLTIVLYIHGESQSPSLLYINTLGELPLTLCNLIKQVAGSNLLKVGYIMKPSRAEDFAKRGAFPMYPTQNGQIFVPLSFDLPLVSQLQEVDVVLHKATDEIISVDLSNSSQISKITYSRGIQELKRYAEDHPECCIIDPFDNVSPVLDRLEIQQILRGLEDLNTEGHCKIRGPYFLKVDDFNEQGLVPHLSEAKLSLPFIVKPQVACGVADSHSMAIVFRNEDIKELKVPLPAIIQEYVDHSSTLYKFYVLGERIFHAVKRSIPNAPVLMKLSESNGLKPLAFDSLKSLPTATGDNGDFMANARTLDLDLVNTAAKWLMGKLKLTIFGFDVVVEERGGDHVIVDLNYLPSFKEVPDDIAIPAFWDAIKSKFESRRG